MFSDMEKRQTKGFERLGQTVRRVLADVSRTVENASGGERPEPITDTSQAAGTCGPVESNPARDRPATDRRAAVLGAFRNRTDRSAIPGDRAVSKSVPEHPGE